MDVPEAAAKMVRDYIKVHGDPLAPYEAMTSLTRQETEWKCNGCSAVGWSRWPNWELEIKHEPNCAWIAWTRALAQDAP